MVAEEPRRDPMRQSRFNPPRPSPEPIPWPSDLPVLAGNGETKAKPDVEAGRWRWLGIMVVGAGAIALAFAVGWIVQRRRRINRPGSALESASNALTRAVAAFDPEAIPTRFDPRECRSRLEQWIGRESAGEWVDVYDLVQKLKYGSFDGVDKSADVEELAARAEAIARQAEAIRLNEVASGVDGPDRVGT